MRGAAHTSIALSATGRCSSQAAIAMRPAVPLWKVIVGVMPTELQPGPRGPGFFFCPSPREAGRGKEGRTSHPQPLVLQSAVKVRDILAVAVVQQRRPPLFSADVFLGRLA